MQMVHEKPETRRHVMFKHNTWDEQWVPTDEYDKHAVLRDMMLDAVEQHDNHVYVGEVHYFLKRHGRPRPPGQKWAASLVVSRVRAAGIEEDEKDMRKRVTRGRPDAKVRKLMAASSTAQPPGVVKTLTDDKKRKRPVKKRRGKKLTVAESEAQAHAEAEAEAARSSKRRVPRARKNKNKQ
eukprot:jgi/Tetstr1/460031/TSEL_005351.t1